MKNWHDSTKKNEINVSGRVHMSVDSDDEYIYRISGESIVPRPENLFETTEVYLIIDKGVKKIWIWAGKKSRLYHRYVAANWAGKLKILKNLPHYKHEVIREGREPGEFFYTFIKSKGLIGNRKKTIPKKSVR
ncbi:MAG: hypothetical protein ACTSRW_16410, partial [Candidatus Helarchaeota archaeon]